MVMVVTRKLKDNMYDIMVYELNNVLKGSVDNMYDIMVGLL